MSSNPWYSMWIRPRSTIRSIIMENPKRALWGLAYLAGLNQMMSHIESISIKTQMGLLPLIVLALVLAPFFGWIIFAFWSWLILVTGRILKGGGVFQTIRAAAAWSCVPLIGSILLWIPLILGFGDIFFRSGNSTVVLQDGRATLLSAILLGKIGFSIWSLVLFVSSLAEVQQFSILRAIGNIILGVIAFFVLWTIVGFLIGSLIFMKWG